MGEVTIEAVSGVDFAIEKGEFCVIVGPSGAGKTTVLNILGGMDSCTSGDVIVDGETVSSFSRKQLISYRRYDVGFVFQFYNLVNNLTAKENVELASQICRDPLPPEEVLKSVGLADRTDNFPSQLSGGEQQRVALARAIVNSPKMIIADEPTGNIDPKMSAEVMDMLRLINQTGITVIVVTHEQVFVDTLGARVVTLNHGRIKSDTAHPEVEEEYMARRMSRGVSDVSDEDSEDEYYEEDDVSNSRTDATDDEPEEDVRPRRRSGSAAEESDLASDISERVSPENRSDAEEIPADSEHSVADDPESLPDDTDKGKEADGE